MPRYDYRCLRGIEENEEFSSHEADLIHNIIHDYVVLNIGIDPNASNIDLAMTWRRTPHGYDFWRDICDRQSRSLYVTISRDIPQPDEFIDP